MRSSKLAFALSLIVVSSLAVACAPAEEEDDNANDQTQNVTGGSGNVDSPTVYLFEGADKNAAPKCAGALLNDKFAVTAKACAKEGMIVGRAADKDGRGARAVVKSIKVPEGADADIAVVELDRVIGGVHAVITHAPLKDGYSVNGVAAKDEGLPVIGTDKNGASSVEARMVSETDKHSAIVPKQGSEICAGDMGAPVCASSSWKVFGYNVYGTCGLSGLVVGAPDAVTPAAPSATQPAPAQPKADGCSAGAWKVAQLGRYAAFLKEIAPEAFQPIVIDKPVIRNFPYAPKDLWGYKTGGKVQSCKIETATLAAVAPNAESGKITAKVSFGSMQERATPYGRFGIALKSTPTQVRWLPAKALSATTGNAFETQFEGVVSADKDGEYLVLFRASANGGEEWTQCDLAGIDANKTGERGLGLKVGTGVTPTDPNKPAEPGKTAPQDSAPTSPSTGDDSYNDPSSAGGDESSNGDPTGEGEEEKLAPKKKKKADSGCSAAPSTGNVSGSSALPILGMLLGLGAISRRRNKKS